jgi:hypothetical protein
MDRAATQRRVAAADIEALVTALIRCPHQVREIPYRGNTTTEEVR